MNWGEILQYGSIPLVAAFVGWSTNWVAIKLTFLPLEFWGPWNPWLGWQGIIPSKARKMAAVAVESTISKLGSLKDVYDEIEPQRIARQIIHTTEPLLNNMTDEVISQHHPVIWKNLPDPVKQHIYDRIHREFPKRIDELVIDIGENLEDLISLKDMIMEHAAEDKEMLNRIFLECGSAEFRFIILSGIYFGLLFGLIQMFVWMVLPAWWVLPAFGFLVGCATNWIALNIIFRPLHPVKVGGFTIQGLFLKRQKSVAATYSRLVTHELITVQNLADAMLNGPKSARTHALIRKHFRPIVDDAVGAARPLIQSVVGSEGLAGLRDQAGEAAVAISQNPFDDSAFNKDRATILERVMRERMEELSSEEFVKLLRPCFQEDEWKLVLLGGGLGVVAGVAQLGLVFGGL